MSDSITRLHIIKARHDTLNRILTIAFASFVCGLGFILWSLDIPLLDQYKMFAGIALMFGAFLFYKIPYFAYRLNYKYFARNPEDQHLMGHGWKQYRKRIIQL